MISVIVPTHNRADKLATVLKAILEDPATDEVIVVLDGCSDGTLQVVEDIQQHDGRLRRLVLSPNVGQPEATLAGVRAATNPVVLCVDDDVILRPGCVGGHARHHAHGSADVIVGAMPVGTIDGRGLDIAQQRYADIYNAHQQAWRRDPETVLVSLWGGNVSLRRNDYIDASDRCDMTLRFHQDQELGFILKAMGRTALFDEGLAATHLYERDLEAVLRDLYRAGGSYSRFLDRYPQYVPPAQEMFGPEVRHPVRRLTVDVFGHQVPRTAVTRACKRLNEASWGKPYAAQLLRVLGRAQYYRGFHDAAGEVNTI